MRWLADFRIEGLDSSWSTTTVCLLARHPRGEFSAPLVPTARVELMVSVHDQTERELEDVLAELRAAIRENRIRIGGHACVDARLESVEASSLGRQPGLRATAGGPQGWYGTFKLDCELDRVIPFPFEPGLVAPARDGDVEFASAFRKYASSGEPPCLAAGIEETEAYWIFPVREIGSGGSIVDRRTGRAFAMGSAFPREVWVWAWERGLTEESSVFVVEACDDAVGFRSALSHVYTFEGEAPNDPITKPLRWDWRALGVFHEMRDALRVRAEASRASRAPSDRGS